MKWYEVVDKDHIRKERNKAKELRSTRWWLSKLREGICYYCGKKFSPEDLTMDHIVPLARGGKSRKGNIVPSCLDCNRNKGLDTPADKLLER